jgi:hypothetical protein
MRLIRACVAVLLCLVLEIPLFGRQATTQSASSSPQAVTLLQNSLTALTAGGSLTDITLSGTARLIAGSDDETGTGILKALASGASRSDLALPSGPRSEVCNLVTAPAAGVWSGPDGVGHAISSFNILSEPAWFFPAFAISRRLTSSNFVASYIGPETHNGQAVIHISVSQTQASPDPPGGPTFAHLTQVDFFLDSSTLLPDAITFNAHPDRNALVDIPMEIDFSNYTAVNGVQVPFHIQKFLNNSLILDFQIQTATPNSGLTASTFAVVGGL